MTLIDELVCHDGGTLFEHLKLEFQESVSNLNPHHHHFFVLYLTKYSFKFSYGMVVNLEKKNISENSHKIPLSVTDSIL